MDTVKKAWGHEIIVAAEPEYSGKILVLVKGAGSSLHRHLKKKETLYLLKGRVVFHTGIGPSGKEISETVILGPGSEPITILPGVWHQFHGLEDSRLMEVGTQHEDSDVERRTQSYASS